LKRRRGNCFRGEKEALRRGERLVTSEKKGPLGRGAASIGLERRKERRKVNLFEGEREGGKRGKG
jgi:hypothetical protein